jgi:site-specific DNA-methyltransferase (adenine-specific)
MICPCCGKHKRPENLDGLGTALKPAMELIAVARKPLSEKTIALNFLKWGTGAINIGACRIAQSEADKANSVAGALRMANSKRADNKNTNEGWNRPWQEGNGQKQYIERCADRMQASSGRWPANVIHDGSDEVIAAFPETESGSRKAGEYGVLGGDIYARAAIGPMPGLEGSSGSAARFFYSAKADQDDRLGSKHPTVKPVDLMQWLCRLVTPKNGTILDPFSGTGTTGEAAFREGFNAVLIEREPEYQADIRRRMALCMSGPIERKHESIKAKTKDQPADHGPLFAEVAE